MSADLLTLTAYFGERMRGRHGFLADELLELFGRDAVADSVVLRGIGGFGPSHQLRTDRTLSTSEELPVALSAVDTPARIEALAGPVAAALTRGVLTLERASTIPPDTGSATLTVYVGRQTRVAGRPAYREICALLHRLGFDSATTLLGVDGTEHGTRRRARFFGTNTEVPVVILAVGATAAVAAALPRVRALVPTAVATVRRSTVCKRDGRLLERPAALPVADARGRPLWQKLTIHSSEAMPVHRRLVEVLRAGRASAGATVLRGIWGFHGAGTPRGDRLLQLGREVPVLTVVLDSPDRIAALFDLIDELTGAHGLVTCDVVPAMVTVDGGTRRGGSALAEPTP